MISHMCILRIRMAICTTSVYMILSTFIPWYIFFSKLYWRLDHCDLCFKPLGPVSPALGEVCDLQQLHPTCHSSTGTKTNGRSQEKTRTPDHPNCPPKSSHRSSPETSGRQNASSGTIKLLFLEQLIQFDTRKSSSGSCTRSSETVQQKVTCRISLYQPTPAETQPLCTLCCHMLCYLLRCAANMCIVCFFDICMCLHVIDATSQEP